MRGFPGFAGCPAQQQLAAATARRQLREKRNALVGQHHMPRFAGFGLPDSEGSAVGIEVMHLNSGQLAVTAARLQGRLH